MNKLSILMLVTLVTFQFAQAEIKLPGIVSSNMVLQRNTNVNLWGWAKPNEKLTIKVSWNKKAIKITADTEGNWNTQVITTLNKEPQSINLKSKESNITLNNILFGEIWLCSGQSNMRQALKGYMGQPTFEGNKAVVNSNNSQIRLFGIKEKASKTPIDTLIAYDAWTEASPASVKNFSAVGYFFGQQLQQTLDVPVGLIMSAWGGSKIQAWISHEVVNPIEKVDLDIANFNKQPNKISTVLFNSMIKPIIPFTIKGAIWYQGESNRNKTELYTQLFPAMVKDWRNRWNQGDFPFYYVQIAPFGYKDTNAAFIRESQLKCLDLIPNSGMAVLTDIGEEKVIHPPKKKEVAERLLYNALNMTYGITAISYMSPLYKSMAVKDSTIIISFDDIQGGIYSPFKELTEFEIAGDDQVFYPAKASIIKKRKVKVWSDEVKNPVAVRYAWKSWVVGSLFNNSLLPASSFRTDNWDQ